MRRRRRRLSSWPETMSASTTYFSSTMTPLDSSSFSRLTITHLLYIIHYPQNIERNSQSTIKTQIRAVFGFFFFSIEELQTKCIYQVLVSYINRENGDYYEPKRKAFPLLFFFLFFLFSWKLDCFLDGLEFCEEKERERENARLRNGRVTILLFPFLGS